MKNPKRPRGRPRKSWKLYDPGRHWNGFRNVRNSYAGARYWLWRPGHREHFFAIVAPPTLPGDSWLVRGDDVDSRYRYVVAPNGAALYVETIRDFTALVKGERQLPTIPPENENAQQT